jgi:DNA-binding transcriptional LysR family regulator
MNLDHVRTFLEIAGAGSFHRAADTLNITQSTVSARIKVLEERLDRPLFTRSRNGVEMTAAGHQFHRYALNLVQTWEHARQEVALPRGFRTLFGLGAQVSLWERLIVRWTPLMRKKAPDVALRLEADYSYSLMRQLSDGLLDVGVMYMPRSMPGLVTEKLLEEKLVLVSTTKRKMFHDYQPDHVFVDWGYDFRAEYNEAYPDAGSPAVSVGLGPLGLQLILENGGSGYFPLRSVRPHLAAKRLFRVPRAPTFKRPAYMVYPAAPIDADLQAQALEALRHIAAQERES